MVNRRNFLRGTAAAAVVAAGAAHGRGLGGSPAAVAANAAAAGGLAWPAITAETRPWTRWWWLGSAVTPEGLRRHLDQFSAAGLGGVEIQPIYEAQWHEERILPYLGPQWLEALDATTGHAAELGMQVDLTTGSGWTFGGPWITPEHSAGRALVGTWRLAGGEQLTEPVRVAQPPHPGLVDEERLSRPDLRPPMPPLPEPPLAALVAREAQTGDVVDLTAAVGEDRSLDWTAPPGDWELTGVFSGLVLKRVERAGPGGKGLMADYFDSQAIATHLQHFGDAIGRGPRGIRALFHDSFELERMDWTEDTLVDFRRLRGYDLVPHLPELFGTAGSPDVRARVLGDVRETFSDLFLDSFALPWDSWSAERGWQTRNQAHGSPANLLDVYGAADIPETEYTGAELVPVPGLRPGSGTPTRPQSLVWRFASSPAHLQGRPLVGAETLTWRDEHFHVSLSQAKPTVDLLFAAGVNHVVFHGTAYSPEDAPWPGLSFYASTELKPTNTIWTDLPALTGYITRCQSVLQAGWHDNDVLVYWPQHDLWADPDGGLGDGAEDLELTPDYTWRGDQWVYGHPTGAGEVAEGLETRGWQLDWVSDRQLAGFEARGARLGNGASEYATVVVPGARLVPLDTVERLQALLDGGATVVVAGDLPVDVPGLADLDSRRARLQELLTGWQSAPESTGAYRVGRGRLVVTAQGADLDTALTAAGATREPLADAGLRVLRRRHDAGRHYFLTNVTADTVDGWWSLGVDAASVGVLDALHGTSGLATTRRRDGDLQVRVRLQPGESLFLRTTETEALQAPVYPVRVPTGRERPVGGRWTVEFLDGGPTVPPRYGSHSLRSWTELGEDEESFSGTARYTLRFAAQVGRGHDWVLDLGDVRESARVRLNGHDLGTLWSIPFQVPVGDVLVEGLNTLEVEVTNLAANRVRALARRGELELPFYMSWRTTLPAEWEPMPSGLLGPVRLVETTS